MFGDFQEIFDGYLQEMWRKIQEIFENFHVHTKHGANIFNDFKFLEKNFIKKSTNVKENF